MVVPGRFLATAKKHLNRKNEILFSSLNKISNIVSSKHIIKMLSFLNDAEEKVVKYEDFESVEKLMLSGSDNFFFNFTSEETSGYINIRYVTSEDTVQMAIIKNITCDDDLSDVFGSLLSAQTRSKIWSARAGDEETEYSREYKFPKSVFFSSNLENPITGKRVLELIKKSEYTKITDCVFRVVGTVKKPVSKAFNFEGIIVTPK